MSALEPRKRPRQARAQATNEALIEAAAQIVAERGLAGFNTNAVAERAGVSIGSLYQYFPNKDSLMAALIERQQAAQFATLESALDLTAGTALHETVRLLVRAAMQHHRDHSLLASALDHEEARLPVDDVLDGFLDRSGAVIAVVFARHADALGDICVERAARTLPALVRAVVDRWANLDPPQLDVAEEEAVRAVLGYLRG